jgi:hypothetical protein
LNKVYSAFGQDLWERFLNQPLGSLTKRELELTLLRAAVDSGLIQARAELLAERCHIPISRAHGYLTDLALRNASITDREGVSRLVALLKISEVVRDDSHFSIPIHDAALRIWLERKMTSLILNAGDTLRRDQVKLTPAGLARIIGASDGIISPFEALQKLPPSLQNADWFKSANKSWKKGMSWPEAIGLLGNAAAIVQTAVSTLLG